MKDYSELEVPALCHAVASRLNVDGEFNPFVNGQHLLRVMGRARTIDAPFPFLPTAAALLPSDYAEEIEAFLCAFLMATED